MLLPRWRPLHGRQPANPPTRAELDRQRDAIQQSVDALGRQTEQEIETILQGVDRDSRPNHAGSYVPRAWLRGRWPVRALRRRLRDAGSHDVAT
jgi:hypothetical protein